MAFLIIGLGNPGGEYENTRHNLGFSVVDGLIGKNPVKKIKTNLQAQIFRFEKNSDLAVQGIAGTVVIKPQNFMNLSGQVAAPYIRKNGIQTDRIIVIHDDLDIPFRDIRVSRGASSGGHNGVQSIIDALGTKDFTRVRLGIGRPPENVPADKFVLQKFSAEERKKLPDITEKAIAAIEKIFLR